MEDKEFLLKLREYIEQVEMNIEGECGGGRSLGELIEHGEVPEIYSEVLRRLAAGPE